MAAPRSVLVTGASGNIGKATLQALAAFSDSLAVKAGVRDPTKSAALTSLGSNIAVVAADPTNSAQFAAALEGVDAAFFIAPTNKDRADIVVAAVEAAKAAKLKHIVVLSVVSADFPSTLFGGQFHKVETAAKASGIPYTLLRLPNFLENLYGNAGSIKGQGAFYDGVDPAKPQTFIAVKDVGEVAAKILSDPSPHVDKTYALSSPPETYANLANYFTQVAGKPVAYVQVPFDAVRGALQGFGLEDWQINGLLEVEEGINEGNPIYSDPSGAKNIETIIERPATTVEAWVKGAAAAFA